MRPSSSADGAAHGASRCPLAYFTVTRCMAAEPCARRYGARPTGLPLTKKAFFGCDRCPGEGRRCPAGGAPDEVTARNAYRDVRLPARTQDLQNAGGRSSRSSCVMTGCAPATSSRHVVETMCFLCSGSTGDCRWAMTSPCRIAVIPMSTPPSTNPCRRFHQSRTLCHGGAGVHRAPEFLHLLPRRLQIRRR